MRFAIVGLGRAGMSFEAALTSVGAECVDVITRIDDPARIDPSIDLVLLTVPDRAIAEVADRLPVGPLVAHVSGATTLAPLLPRHDRCGSIHPLSSLPDATTGAAALLQSAHLAIAGSTEASRNELFTVAELLGGRPFAVDDSDRAAYHAAAAIAANHLVALTAQIERITTATDLPLDPFIDMMRTVLDNVAHVGATAALTGPTARADWDTVARHLEAIGSTERRLYLCLAEACAALAGTHVPPALLTDPDQEHP